MRVKILGFRYFEDIFQNNEYGLGYEYCCGYFWLSPVNRNIFGSFLCVYVLFLRPRYILGIFLGVC